MIYTTKSRRLAPPLFKVGFLMTWIFLLFSLRNPLPVQPPPLKTLLRQTPPVIYPAPETPPEWKRPLTLTAYATPKNGAIEIVLFTTGVDTEELGRSFTSIGCLVGNHAFPAVALHPAMVTCTVQRELLIVGMPMTVAIKHDDQLTKALKIANQTLGGESFSFQDGDVVSLSETPKELLKYADKVAAIRTLVKWDDGYIDEATGVRYELCLMTAMRQYPYLLKDWIDFYRRMGVDKMYIYENWATEDLDKLVGSDFVEVVRWPWVRSQMQSNNHFLLASKTRCKYVAFFDADEFAMVGGEIEENMLKKYIRLRLSEGYNQVIFHFLMMLNSGYVERPKGPLPALYTRREKDQVIKLGKPVIDGDTRWEFHKIHLVGKRKGEGGRSYWNTTMELEPLTISHNAMLVHYTKRSWEEFVLKNRIGGASVMTRGRPKKALDVDDADDEYMDFEKSVEFTGFRERWKRIMMIGDSGKMSLIRSRDGGFCRMRWCPGCWFKRTGKEECFASQTKSFSGAIQVV